MVWWRTADRRAGAAPEMQDNSAQAPVDSSGSQPGHFPLSADLIREAMRDPAQNSELIRLMQAKAEIDRSRWESVTTQFIRRYKNVVVWTVVGIAALALLQAFTVLRLARYVHTSLPSRALGSLGVLGATAVGLLTQWILKRIRAPRTGRRGRALTGARTDETRSAPQSGPQSAAGPEGSAVRPEPPHGGDHASAGAS